MRTLSNGRAVITTLALSFTLLSAMSVAISAQTPQASPNTSEAQLKRIRESTQARLDQLHAAAGFPGATIGFVLPDGRSGSVSTGVSDSYAGEYEVAPGVILTITRDGEHLMAQTKGQPRAEIFPSSETEYFSRRIDVQIKFVKNEQGQVTGMVIVQNGRNIPARKIK